MNILKQIETDIKEFLKEKVKTKLFFNESDFQLNLAFFLMEKKKYDNVFLEYSVPLKSEQIKDKVDFWEKLGRKPFFSNKEKIDIDIVIEKGALFYLIELKYKLKSESITLERFGERIEKVDIFKDQGGVPRGRYDFWKDVARLEFVRGCFEDKFGGGICVFLTNNEEYSRDNRDTSEDFTMKAGKRQYNKDILKFKTPKLAKKYNEFSLLENYQIDEWYDVTNNETKITFHYCVVKVEKGTVAVQLHKIFNSLERFDYKSFSDPEKNKRIPKKGVYIFFEKGEKISIPNGEKLDRIVRIGTHYNQEGLQERLKNHFTTSNSVFRENVKEALVKRYGNNITNEFINNYMRENFSFVILEDKEGDKEKRRKWEYKLTQTISKAVFLGEIIPSEKWLGKDAAFDEIIEGGLWQKEGIYNEFTSQDIIELISIL